MRNLIIILLVLLSGSCAAQSTVYLRGDTIRAQKAGGNATLVLENAQRDSINGVLMNYGGGRTMFKRIRAINDSQFVVGTDTVTIAGATGGGGGTPGGSDRDVQFNNAGSFGGESSFQYLYEPNVSSPSDPENLFLRVTNSFSSGSGYRTNNSVFLEMPGSLQYQNGATLIGRNVTFDVTSGGYTAQYRTFQDTADMAPRAIMMSDDAGIAFLSSPTFDRYDFRVLDTTMYAGQ